ncbi:hypothetical protein LRH25_31520 [Ideonella azotifigens]|uniref:Uncharacterized protein n=1 Tax=Ideonella azotifigens TaxID=513160 RepID=A0ABN1K052_9BURK|nr:hypothetical protein [Ideonella azotifigens]MCD2344855.1 hypothetical protein [Ideonella azotifigens]
MFQPNIRRMLAALLTAAATTVPAIAWAAPANDDIAQAIVIAAGGTAATVLMTGATQSATDPSCGTTPYQSVWYRYTSPVDQFIQARVSATTGSTPLRPRMAVWGGAPGALSAVQCHPDAHEVEFYATAGTAYYFEVYSPVANGETTLNLNVNPHAYVNPWSAVPPANDLFWFAEAIPGVPWSTNGDVGAAQGDSSYDPFTPCYTDNGVTFCYPYGDTLWYSFTATAQQDLDVLFTSAYVSPVVQVMTGTLDQPTLVANSFTPGKSKPGATRFSAQPGVTYLFEFASGGAENTADVYASLALRPSPPVTTGSVSAARTDKLYHRWVWVDPFYEKVTHVVVGVNLSCSTSIPSVGVSFTITQGAAQGSGSGTVPCAGGKGNGTIDAIVPNAFKPGTASVALNATDYDSNFNQTAAAAPVQLKLAAGP